MNRCRACLLWGALLVASSLTLLAGCRSATSNEATTEQTKTQPREPPPVLPDAAELTVAVRGCRLLVGPEGRRCRMAGDETLSLWLSEQAETPFELRLAGEAVTPRVFVEPEGLLLQFEVADPAGLLELVVSSPDAVPNTTRARWSMQLAPRSSDYDELEKNVDALYAAGDPEGARALFAAGVTKLDADEAALAGCIAAPLALGSGELPAVIEQLRAGPAVGCLGHAYVISSWVQLYEEHDINAAQRTIDAAKQVGAQELRVAVHLQYHQADLDLIVGRLDQAYDGFERVSRFAKLIDDRRMVGAAQLMKATTLTRLGRFAEAEALVESLVESLEAALDGAQDNDQVVVDIRHGISWLALLRREDDPQITDPTATLEQLIEVYAARGDDQSVARARLNIALAAVQSQDFERAKAVLASVDRSVLAPFELVWLELIAARSALGRERPAAAAGHLERAEALADLAEDPELVWLVTSAVAQLAYSEGRKQAALEAHARGAQLADELALSVPGSAGRSMLVTAHSRADAEHVSLLLELDQPEQALCVAASARARHLRALWARLRPPLSGAALTQYQDLLGRFEKRQATINAALEQAWALSTTELAALRQRLRSESEQGDVLLAQATALVERDAPSWSCERILPRTPERALLTMLPNPTRTGWWFMFARADQRPTVVALTAEGDASELAGRALEQLESQLRGVETLVVIPVAEFVSVDFQRLLLARPTHPELSVRYSLGLGELPATGAAASREAAVVAGATNLDAVTREVATVAQQLQSHGWTVSPTWSPSAAQQPMLLHYSGHGHHAGLAGWRSFIEVPEAGRVTAAHIVAAQRAPRLVVLGACSAGSSDGEIIDGGMNLAAAFLLAGAELVVAPSGPVDDDIALSLADRLYRQLTTPDPDILVRALTTQQRAELARATIEATQPGEPGLRSILRWRAWVP
ncbi:CHAT domain-containing protein [Enhygromyxa salina]|uniref:CHAT domain-containing protein n=1 Tax=Enhygromyxa salina TaxID=215803 RepID=UPI0011B27035|nr:CHAT domain-containing protein [Enhygromyxa salina]